MAFTDAGGDLYVASQQILRFDELTVTSSCGLAGRSGFACTSQKQPVSKLKAKVTCAEKACEEPARSRS